jgi:hypothetical protein
MSVKIAFVKFSSQEFLIIASNESKNCYLLLNDLPQTHQTFFKFVFLIVLLFCIVLFEFSGTNKPSSEVSVGCCSPRVL